MNPSLVAAAFVLLLAAFPGRCRAQDEAVPKIPRRDISSGFHALQVPKRKPDDPAPSKSDQLFAATVAAFNAKLGKAQAEAKKTGDKTVVADTFRKEIPAVNAEAERPDIDPASRNAVAGINLETGNYGEAKKLYGDTLRSKPDDKDAAAGIAAAHYGLGDYRAAIAEATHAAQLDPDNQSAYTTRALAHYAAGDYLQAVEDANRALALDKNDAAAFETLQLAKGRIKPPKLSMDARELAQAEQVKREYQSMLQQQNQVEESAGGSRPTPAAVDKFGEAMNRDAGSKIAIKDYWGAIDVATKALAANPKNARALYLRAAAYNLVGRPEEAAQDATASLVLLPGDDAAFDARAKAFLALGRFKEAADDSARSIALNPNNAYAYADRARAFEKLDDLPAMLADYQRAATLSPQFETAYRDAAAAHALPMSAALGQMSPMKPAQAPRPAPSNAARHFWVIVASSVIGGLLIATGLLHILSGQLNRKITAAIGKMQEAQAAAAPKIPDAPPAALRANYEILRAIGQGGMGVVYEARDKALGRKVAIKKMRDEIKLDPRERERFLQEARTVAALHHPGIIDIHAIIEDSGDLYLVFEHVAGKTVDELLAEKKRLTLAEARHILKGVCEALDFAHRHDVVHRDLKPSNIMVADDGRVKVMDFGIARRAEEAGDKFGATNTVVGTPLYMAPETARGVIRKESDVYALGACLYEMVTGERPFPGPAATSAKLAMQYIRPTRVMRELPPAMDALIEGALQPDPDKRLATPKEFLRRLEAVETNLIS